MAEFTNLDRAKEFQQAPLGSTSSLSQANNISLRNVTGNRRALERDYNMALRSLRREARRGKGDSAAKAAIAGVNLRERAQQLGLQPGGIQSSESRMAGDRAAYKSLVAETQRSQAAADAANNVLGQPTTKPVPAPVSPLFTGATANTQLGKFAQNALNKNSIALSYTGDDPTAQATSREANTFLRQGLDRALGQATTDAERTELQAAGEQLGVTPEAFKKRTDWWKTRRSR